MLNTFCEQTLFAPRYFPMNSTGHDLTEACSRDKEAVWSSTAPHKKKPRIDHHKGGGLESVERSSPFACAVCSNITHVLGIFEYSVD